MVIFNKQVSSPYRETSKFFFASREWRELRFRVLERYGYACMCCGRNRKDHGVVLHVDHIKPRSKYPELELSASCFSIHTIY